MSSSKRLAGSDGSEGTSEGDCERSGGDAFKLKVDLRNPEDSDGCRAWHKAIRHMIKTNNNFMTTAFAVLKVAGRKV